MSAAVEKAVRDRLGLDASTLGPNVLSRAIEGRMAARGITDPSLYAALVLTEQAELDALAADLVVPETWFFRGGHPLFDRLASFVLGRAARPSGARVLSAPCSTGEEPYSLAIAFFDPLNTAGSVTIDAIDLSERNVARATEGRYSASAFREPGPDRRPGYFRKTGIGWEVLPRIRDAVRFQVGNLTDPLFLERERPYDLIVCRNVFIYFMPEAKQRAMANIDRLLAADGRLCVTPAEADRLPTGRFVPEGPTEFGIYRRASAVSGVLVPPPPAPAPPPPAPAPAAPASTAPPLADSAIAAARVLADSGRLADARAACEELVRTRPGDADVFALLGVVHLAAGNADAAYDAFGKALYLNADHVEAVSHMIGLCERRGNVPRATALRARLARLAPPEGT